MIKKKKNFGPQMGQLFFFSNYLTIDINLKINIFKEEDKCGIR